MRIAVDALPAAGRDIPFSNTDAWALDAVTTSFERAPDQLTGIVKLRRATVPSVIMVDVVANASIKETPCDRCGEICSLTVAVAIQMLFAPEETNGADFDGMSLASPERAPDSEEEGIELRAEDLDLGWYTKGEIVLADVLCEAITLASPSRIVCADSKGCDKRTGDLLSATHVQDSPFAKLAAFRRGSGEG